MSDFDRAYDDEAEVFGDPYPALIEDLAVRTPGRLLDLGCGQGRNAVALAALGYEVTAVDAAIVGVRQTVTRAAAGGRKVNGMAADLTDFPIRGSYDVVLLDMVLHALEVDRDRRRLLDALVAAVRPGGVACVVVPEPGPLVDEVVVAMSSWPTTVREVEHRLESGPNRGDYTFIAVVGERPAM